MRKLKPLTYLAQNFRLYSLGLKLELRTYCWQAKTVRLVILEVAEMGVVHWLPPLNPQPLWRQSPVQRTRLLSLYPAEYLLILIVQK